jgi:predicted anti-sigma-YlaC factor YlaD
MKCEEIRERMPDAATGLTPLTAEEGNHLATCTACTEQLKSMRATMALLDEWQVPEPSPYFDVRLQARLREERTKQQVGWLHWFRRPVLAAALTVAMGIGVGLFFTGSVHHKHTTDANISAPPGSAVSDLQTLDNNHDMYSDFELLDDLDVQQNVTANP